MDASSSAGSGAEMPATPLTASDEDLVEAARAVLRRHYRPFWHMVAAALRTHDGRVFTGIHLGATVGRMQICAEPIALGRAILEADGTVDTIVAVRHPKEGETARELAIVPPCGGCREMLADHAPDAMVIVPGLVAPVKVAVRALLPLPYRR